MSKIRIAIDMDDVLADTLSRFLDRYNAEFSEHLTKNALVGKQFDEVIPSSRRPAVAAYPYDPNFFVDLEVMPQSQEIVRSLTRRYEVFIATAAMEYPPSFAAKFSWLQKNFSFIPASHIVFCGDKSILSVDFLIDDNSRHFTRLHGQGILFDAPHNLHEEKYPRVHDWHEVSNYFLCS